jgi:hypothetical protein
MVFRKECDISVGHLYKWALTVVERCLAHHHAAETQTPGRASNRDGRACTEYTWLRSGTLLQQTNDSSRVHLNRIINLKPRTTYEPGVVVLTHVNQRDKRMIIVP